MPSVVVGGLGVVGVVGVEVDVDSVVVGAVVAVVVPVVVEPVVVEPVVVGRVETVGAVEGVELLLLSLPLAITTTAITRPMITAISPAISR